MDEMDPDFKSKLGYDFGREGEETSNIDRVIRNKSRDMDLWRNGCI